MIFLTGTDIKNIIEAETDEQLEDSEVVTFINSCLIEHAEEFRKTSTQSITSDGDSWYARTDGHLSIVKITEDGEDWNGDWEISHDRTQIRFLEEGTYVVTSLIMPTPISAIGDTIAVNAAFELGIARVCEGLYKSKDNDQNPEGLRLKAEGGSLIRKAAGLLEAYDRRPGIRLQIRRSAGDWSNVTARD